MDMMYWAIIVLGAFVAIWLLFVAPAERRHHERKLAILRKRIHNRADRQEEDVATDQNDAPKEP
jgi:predicted MFS family arabinose efflux permease